MPRQPKLRKKKTGTTTYWFTQAGGYAYFGNDETVSFTDVRVLFNDLIKSLSENQEDSKRKQLVEPESRGDPESGPFAGVQEVIHRHPSARLKRKFKGVRRMSKVLRQILADRCQVAIHSFLLTSALSRMD